MAGLTKYDVFISYKHCDPDSEIAMKLQKKLESYKLPRSVAKKIGRRRLDRIFRDDSELAVADNLSDEINRALRHSEYLIAICSPEYLRSVWCMREIETFIQDHDRKHVLLVLADGEPETAFPEIMTYDEVISNAPDGSWSRYTIKNEPLAADCRAEDPKTRNELINKAVVRLAASLFGVNYDDLVQRQRKEKYKRRTMRTLIAFGVMLAIIGICLFFLAKISRQNEIIMQKYADTLAATSNNLLRDGHRIDAVYAARLALPDDRADNYSEPAVKAMVSALGLYDIPGYDYDEEILLPCSAGYDLAISSFGKYAGICGLDQWTYVVDIETGETVFSDELAGSRQIYFDGERGFVFRREGENFKYFNIKDKTETDLGVSEAEIISNTRGNGYAVVETDKIVLYKGADQLFTFAYDGLIANWTQRHDIQVDFSKDGRAAYIFYTGLDDRSLEAYAVDLTSATSMRLDLPAELFTFQISTDGNSVVWVQDEDGVIFIYLLDMVTSELKRIDMPDPFLGILVSGDQVVAYRESEIYILDRDLNIKDISNMERVPLNASVLNDGITVKDVQGGVYFIKDGKNSFVRPSGAPRDIVTQYRNDTLYLIRAGENNLFTYKYRSSKYLTPFTGALNSLDFLDAETEDILDSFLSRNDSISRSDIYDVTLCEGDDLAIVQLWDGTIFICDGNTFECLRTIYSIEGTVVSFYYDEEEKLYYVSAENIEVFDLDLKNIYEISDCRISGTDKATGKPIAVKCDTDEKYLIEPVSYDDIIEIADARLKDYEPDEKIKEKYSLE